MTRKFVFRWFVSGMREINSLRICYEYVRFCPKKSLLSKNWQVVSRRKHVRFIREIFRFQSVHFTYKASERQINNFPVIYTSSTVVDSTYFQGILSSLIHQKDNKTSLRLGSAVYIQVNDLMDRAAHCSSNAQITLRESSPQYYNLVGHAVSQPWRTVRRHNSINPNLVTGFNQGQLSDDILWKYESCLARLLGSPVHGGKPCVITAECWGLMTRPGETGYVLTHQALYFMLGEQRGKYCSCLQSLFSIA